MNSYRQGQDAYRIGKYDDALTKFTSSIKQSSSSSSSSSSSYSSSNNNNNDGVELYMLYSNRCACYLQLNRLNEALEDAKKVVSLNDTFSKGYSRLGTCYMKLNMLNESFHAFEKSVKLDPTNTDAYKSLNKVKDKLTGNSSYTSSNNSTSTSGTAPSSPSSQRPTAAAGGGASIGGDIVSSIKIYLINTCSSIIAWYTNLSDDNKKYTLFSMVALFFYWFFFTSSSTSRYHDSYDDYGYSYGHSTGLSWSAWGFFMLAAWQLPPMFPSVLGQYARPFFGMSMTTFMWILNMVTQNRSSLGGGFSSFNRNRRRY